MSKHRSLVLKIDKTQKQEHAHAKLMRIPQANPHLTQPEMAENLGHCVGVLHDGVQTLAENSALAHRFLKR